MRLPSRVLALGFVLALFSMAVATPARADMGKPTWSTGDFWSYSYTGSIFAFVNGPGTYRLEVIGIDTVSVDSASYEAYRARLTVNGSNVVQYHGGDQWYRTSDLSLVKQTFNVTVTVVFEFTVIVTITYDPPLAVQWPLTTNKNWSTSSTLTTVTQFLGFPPSTVPAQITSDYRVEAASTVTVGAGTFDTTPVRSTSGNNARTYWAPAAGNYARQQRYSPNNQETSSAELTAYQYSGGGFLGLPLFVWFLILLLVIVIAIGLIMRRRRQRGAFVPPPPGSLPPR